MNTSTFRTGRMPPGGRWLRTRWDTRLYPANRGIVSVLTPCAERMISPFFTIIVFRRAKLQKSMNKMQSSLYKSCTSVQFLRGRLVQPRRRHSRRPYTGLRAAGSRMWFPDRSLWIFPMPCGSFRPRFSRSDINIFNLCYLNKCKRNRAAAVWKASFCARAASIFVYMACKIF